MATKRLPQSTAAELNVLKVLGGRGPGTVRQVQRHLNQQCPTGCTTVLNSVQLMLNRGLVERDESKSPRVYQASSRRSRTEEQLPVDVLDQAFEGSSARLIMRALSTRKATPEERDEILGLLDERGKSSTRRGRRGRRSGEPLDPGVVAFQVPSAGRASAASTRPAALPPAATRPASP